MQTLSLLQRNIAVTLTYVMLRNRNATAAVLLENSNI